MSNRRGAGLDAVSATASALLRLVGRRMAAEWRATPFYAIGLSGPRPTGLAVSPRDFRPIDLEIGRQILLGRMTLAGATLEIGVGGDPWDTASPTRAFAVELHRFAWLPSLLAQGPNGVEEALRLVLDWERMFSRVTPFVWGAETLERRVFNLACGLRRPAERASEIEEGELLAALARQAMHLLRLNDGPLRRTERAAVVAVAGAALAGRAGDRLTAAALPKLDHALAASLLPDGGLKSRSPEQALELLFDLLTLDDVLLQRGREAPDAVSRAIDRVTHAVKFFTLGDGRLAAFQGGEAAALRRIGAALAHDDGEGRVYGYLPHSGYHRLAGRTLLAMVDAAGPAEGAWSLAACAQPLALEITCGGDRLIANTGWTPDAQATQALRLTDGGSTASLGDGSAGHPLRGLLARGLGPRLVGGPKRVEARRNENEAGVWLELSHDGWLETFGLLHDRRLFLDTKLDELRGEDRFEPAANVQAPRRAPSYAVRFHLPPEVQVSLARDKRSVLLRGPSNRGWWFRNDAPDVLLETSTHFEDHLAHRGAQIVLKGPINAVGGARVRWKLTPVDPADPRSGVKAAAAQPAAPSSAQQAAR
jgi:uncharacterized heparinase superfamily protein